MTYNSDNLRSLFQGKFNQQSWYQFLKDFFRATELKSVPEKIIGSTEGERGYYLGNIETSDSYRIGFFQYDITNSDVTRKRVGLRNLVKSFVNPSWGEFDAALVVFDSHDAWRLSFVCDIKGEKTSPKRYTFVFGDCTNYYNTPVSRFLSLQRNSINFDNIKDAFSVEALTKQFYQDLFEWYQWATDEQTGVYFPNLTSTTDDDRDGIDIHIIRLITRIMFVWFIKQKGLVPERLFNTDYLKTILKDFAPMSSESGNYYNAILQNLFFATLNRAIEDEDGKRRGFAKLKGHRDVKNLYRYEEMFSIGENDVIRLFSEVPFLNGGLFECLDKTVTNDGVEKSYYYDGFSRNDAQFANGHFKHRAFLPNTLFFKPEVGLISILSRYNFTIEENTPNEQQVALDPELLGKVFENLLGAYNPETKETARNQSGSFYTPREIVNYMVDESLITYLGDTPLVRSLFKDDFHYDQSKAVEYKAIVDRLKQIKVLDPACGSGAFPMGLLNRMVEIVEHISPNEKTYELKLAFIENCIYGSDIQSIAAQITKLRFFISLICNCEKDDTKPNYGIPTLPNLETKFVAANSLISKKKREQQLNLYESPEIEPTKQALQNIRHQHFSAKTAGRKIALRKQDEELRERLALLLRQDEYYDREDARQLAEWNPYDQNAVAKFFDPEWMFGVKEGFDIVIGNPPYIQLQNNGGELAKLYENCGYKTFARTGDIYCLFYERGWQLLKRGGHLCFITSNKWMRAGYGEKTREFFATKTNPMLLIDFAGVKIFESATVDTNILLFAKSENKHETICAVTNKENKDSVKNLSDFVQQQNIICDFSNSDSWVILSPIEQSIKRKIEAIGTPLKDWDIQINYGIKTGFNDAFIISTEKRNDILSNCLTEDEKKRTAELIRPILRGRDIKRYGYDWADLWLIYIPWHFPYQFDESIQGASEKAERAFEEQYPTVYAHMLQYKEPLSKRNKAETGIRYEWYAMQRWGAKYWEDFSKPKVVYMEIQTDNPEEGYPFPCYSYDENWCVVLNTAYIMSSDSIDPKYVLGILNSCLGKFLVKLYVTQLQERQFRMLSQYVMKFPIVKPTKNQENEMIRLVEIALSHKGTDVEKEIDKLAFEIFHLSESEIDYLLNRNREA